MHAFATAIPTSEPANKAMPEWNPDAMDQLRRQLLTGLAAAGAAAALPPSQGLEHLRALVNSGVGSESLTDWEETAEEYAQAVVTRPRAQVVTDVALDLLVLQKAMRTAVPGPEQTGWLRVNARLTFIMAHCLGADGQKHESRQWWNTARRAAQQSGDHELVAVACGYEAMQALCEQRPAAVIVRLAEAARTAAAGRPSAGVAEAHGAVAQVHARLGDMKTAEGALAAQAEVFERLPDAVTGNRMALGGWPEARLLHTRSYVLTYSKNNRAWHAHEEALKSYPAARLRPIAQIQLHQALMQVRSGDLAGGLDHAITVVEGLPSGDRSAFVQRSAADVADAGPARDRSNPQVAEYRRRLGLPIPEGV
ncbi:hypothetical protein [Sphaerisporangium sp. NPDC051011]|uniref:hypothetical protein n=1 Tax=Sphaerisporangium sp. NPDC051011 TaxID=3155792 RepID=UPI003402F62C